MRISRLTVDKLGVKLYDKVSAVIAELIANAYDADATHVTVEAPMGQFLASKAGGTVTDKGFQIQVADDGIGMTPDEVQQFFLVVGSERRKDKNRGATSPRHHRQVMGRKGVGKLAPFGICKTIEVVSSGGGLATAIDGSQTGYLTSHIILEYDGIVAVDNEPDERYPPKVGNLDESFQPNSGTTITLKDFAYRRVPPDADLDRQIAQRFGIRSPHWRVDLQDNTKACSATRTVGEFEVDVAPKTRLTFAEDGKVRGPDDKVTPDLRAGFDHEGEFRPVVGWVGYSKAPYKDDLMAGVRIYCRKKIAAQTSIFNQRAGFTGEHDIRSYLVGELHADWLDEDEDLIQTDRRDILWSDELATSFQTWGQGVVKRLGVLSRDPTRKATMEIFLTKGNVIERIRRAFPSDEHLQIRDRATEMAKLFGRTMNRSEAEDPDAVKELVDLSIDLAPHLTLDDMMREAVEAADRPISVLGGFLRTARIAELSSFGRIALDRLKVIERLKVLKDGSDTQEAELQQLITDAPWLVHPEWAPVTENEWLSTLRSEFETYYEAQTGQPISLAEFKDSQRRPDFVMSSQESVVQIIEIKTPGHRLTNNEMDRVISYYDNMDGFLNDPGNSEFRKQFHDFHITLVCDKMGLTGAQRAALNGYENDSKLTRMTWNAFLLRTRQAHSDFLAEFRKLQGMKLAVDEEP